jgi:hypothetical protein
MTFEEMFGEVFDSQNKDKLFRIAFTDPYIDRRAIAFMKAMRLAGVKDYEIRQAVFEDLQEAGLI